MMECSLGQLNAIRHELLAALIYLCVAGGSTISLLATEKLAIAADAKVIVEGRLTRTVRLPTLRGWRVSGETTVSRWFRGGGQMRSLSLPYVFVCSCCPIWPPPDLDPLKKPAGLWFLRNQDSKWTSNGSCADPGWRPAEEKDALERFLLRQEENDRLKQRE